jgi:hypothetical protein
MRSDGQGSIRLTVDKLHRTDSISSMRLDASDYEADRPAPGRLTSNENELDNSDNSSQSNNSAGEKILIPSRN